MRRAGFSTMPSRWPLINDRRHHSSGIDQNGAGELNGLPRPGHGFVDAIDVQSGFSGDRDNEFRSPQVIPTASRPVRIEQWAGSVAGTVVIA